jgi:hypothetical protein
MAPCSTCTLFVRCGSVWAHRPLTPQGGRHGDGLSDGSAGGVSNASRDGITQPFAHAAMPISGARDQFNPSLSLIRWPHHVAG